MRRLRFLLIAMVVVAATSIAYAPVGGAAAGNGDAYPKTDFTRVTPANALFYATLQSSSALEARTLSHVASSIAAQPQLQNLLNMVIAGALGSSAAGTGGTNIQQLVTLLTGTLGHIFNGETALAMLPIGATTAISGTTLPRIHLLLDAGLQSGATAAPLLFGLATFGLSTTSQPSYHGVAIVGIDLNALARAIGKAINNATLAAGTLIPANGPLSSTFYAAVAGAVLVLASDIPTLQAALDTYRNASLSIASADRFGETVGLLPEERFATLYVHLSSDLVGQFLWMLTGLGSGSPASPQQSATPGLAVSLTAESNALLISLSAPPHTRSMTIPLL